MGGEGKERKGKEVASVGHPSLKLCERIFHKGGEEEEKKSKMSALGTSSSNAARVKGIVRKGWIVHLLSVRG